MPTRVIGGGIIPSLNIQPNIVQTPQDDIERRIALAHLVALEQQPVLASRAQALAEQKFNEDRRQFDLQQLLQKAGLAETTQYHVGEEADRTEKNKIAREALAQEMQRAHEANQSRMAEAVLTHLPNLNLGEEHPDTLKLAATTLTKMGYPELSQGVTEMHKQGVEKTAATALAQIAAVKKVGGDASKVLLQYQNNPEVMDYIKDKLPPTDVAPTTGTESTLDLGDRTRRKAAFSALVTPYNNPTGVPQYGRNY